MNFLRQVGDTIGLSSIYKASQHVRNHEWRAGGSELFKGAIHAIHTVGTLTGLDSMPKAFQRFQDHEWRATGWELCKGTAKVMFWLNVYYLVNDFTVGPVCELSIQQGLIGLQKCGEYQNITQIPPLSPEHYTDEFSVHINSKSICYFSLTALGKKLVKKLAGCSGPIISCLEESARKIVVLVDRNGYRQRNIFLAEQLCGTLT